MQIPVRIGWLSWKHIVAEVVLQRFANVADFLS